MEPREISTRYRRVDPAFWTDGRIQALSPMPPNPPGLLLFLMTTGAGGMIPGVVPLGVAAAAEVLGWDPQDFRKQLDELCDAGLVKADVRARLFYVVGAVHDSQLNPNMVTSWRATWHELMNCPLKEEIWQELYADIKKRGETYVEAFQKACPKGSGNCSPNRFGDGSANKDKDQEKDKEQEKETDKDKDSGSGPGQVCPLPEGNSGREGGPGQSPESCLGHVPGHVPGHAPGPDAPEDSDPVPEEADQPRRRVHVPDPRWYETIDDVEAREAGQSTPSPSNSQEVATANHSIIPPPLQKIINAWNTRVVPKNPLASLYEEQEALAHLPLALEAMEDPRSEHGFEVIFQAVPRLPFYLGANKTGFKPTLLNFFKKFANGDFKCVEVAEDKLKRDFHIEVNSPMPMSRAEAEAAQLRKSGPKQSSATITNNLDERMRSGKE